MYIRGLGLLWLVTMATARCSAYPCYCSALFHSAAGQPTVATGWAKTHAPGFTGLNMGGSHGFSGTRVAFRACSSVYKTNYDCVLCVRCSCLWTNCMTDQTSNTQHVCSTVNGSETSWNVYTLNTKFKHICLNNRIYFPISAGLE